MSSSSSEEDEKQPNSSVNRKRKSPSTSADVLPAGEGASPPPPPRPQRAAPIRVRRQAERFSPSAQPEDDNDAFQNLDLKQYVELEATQDVYSDELKKKEQEDFKNHGKVDWCPLCRVRPGSDDTWTKPMYDLIPEYAEMGSVPWAQKVQALWEEHHFIPELEDINRNYILDEHKQVVGYIDPELQQTKFFWPLTDILVHFREHRTIQIIQCADRAFKQRYLYNELFKKILYTNGAFGSREVDDKRLKSFVTVTKMLESQERALREEVAKFRELKR